MIFEMLRTNRVDLLRYLPKFLAQDQNFKDVQDTLSWEHEQYRLKLVDIIKQFFVETATWGLTDWERIYDLHPAATDTYELRRGRLLAKMRGMGTITLLVMNSLINSVVPAKDAVYVENVAPGVCRVDVQLAYNLAQIRQIVDTYKPAHLTCVISHSIKMDLRLYVGLAAQQLNTILIVAAEPFSGVETGGFAYIGGAISKYKKISVGRVSSGSRNIIETEGASYLGSAVSAYKKILITQEE